MKKLIVGILMVFVFVFCFKLLSSINPENELKKFYKDCKIGMQQKDTKTNFNERTLYDINGTCKVMYSYKNSSVTLTYLDKVLVHKEMRGTNGIISEDY